MNDQIASRIKEQPAMGRSAILDFIELMKPELTGLSVLTALCGYYLGAVTVNGVDFFLTGLGTLLLGGGAGALNQYAERSFDLLMKRTERRPLPAGRLNPDQVLFFGILTSTVGLLILFLGLNVLTGVLGVATFVLYLFVYTPLKRKTWTATLVGAIPGALPPVIGWTAAGGSLDLSAGILFLILFLWQIPHFLSLAWMYRKDYARAGYKMLTVVDESGTRAAMQSLLYCSALIPAALAMTFVGTTGTMYGIGSVLLGTAFLLFAVQFRKYTRKSLGEQVLVNQHARLLFFASLMYLPALFFLMTVDKV
ncbi:MAG: heme o synthase [Bacteroidota bacterium]